MAAERDQLQADRPEGCWCLGLGGRIPVALAQITKPEDERDWPMSWREFCSCEEGQAAEREADRILREYQVESRAIRLKRILGRASFGHYQGQTWNSYLALVEQRIGRVPRSVTAVVKQLRLCAQPGSTTWFYIWGPYGTGKTAALVVIMDELLDAHPDLVITTIGEMLEKVQATFGHKAGDEGSSTDDVIQAYRETSLLLVDDLGNENESTTPWARTTVWRMLNERYMAGDKRTGFTSNLSPEALEESLGAAVAQRILEDVLEVDMSICPNLRER